MAFTPSARSRRLSNRGERVDVLGFLGIEDRHPVLEDSTFLVRGRGPVPLPVNITPAQALQGGFDSALVKIQGRLVQTALTPDQRVLVLKQGTKIFTAVSKTKSPAGELESLREGTLLEVTGICVVDTDASGNPTSFKIRFDTPQDVVVLQMPSWWTVGRALALGGILGVAILAALAWVATLRRRTQAQTGLIRATLDSTAEGILVLNGAGKIVIYNAKFAELLGLPNANLLSGDDRQLLDLVLPQLKDPEAFLRTVRGLEDGSEAQRDDLVELKDGRVLRTAFGSPTSVGEKHWQGLGIPRHYRAAASGEGITGERRTLSPPVPAQLAGVYRATLAGQILDCNEACARIFGFSSTRVNCSGKTPKTSIRPPLTRSAFITRLQEHGSLSNFEHCLKRKGRQRRLGAGKRHACPGR